MVHDKKAVGSCKTPLDGFTRWMVSLFTGKTIIPPEQRKQPEDVPMPLDIPPPTPAVDKAETANARGLEYFKRGEYDRAVGEFLVYLSETNRADLISLPADEGRGIFGSDSSDEAIRDYIDRRRAEWESGALAPPHFLTQRPSATPQNFADVKVLLVFSRYIHNDVRFMSNDMTDHFYETAVRAGMIAEVFFVDECSYPGLAPTPREDALLKLAELKELVERSKPDIVFFDAQYIGTETTLSVEFVADLKRQSDVRVIGAMCDAWQDRCVPMADYWLPVIDAMYHFAPGSPMEVHSSHPEKLVWSGFPVNRARFYNAPAKDVSISFSGTYDFGNRAFWLCVAAMAAAELDLRNTRIVGHERQKCDSDTMDAYAAAMRRSKVVLNLPMRYNGEYAVTGRIWQALHCGDLLLEEYNELTEAYFVPYVHYVPFRSAGELTRLIRFFSENEDYARGIGVNAARFMEAEYSESRIWSDILKKVMDAKCRLAERPCGSPGNGSAQ